MAAKKYLALVTGKIKEIIATVISTGAANDGDLVALDATGRIDTSVLPVGVGPLTKTIVASEDLASGDFVNIWNDGGTAKIRKADASTPAKQADGYVLASVTTGNNATVYFEDFNTQLSGLTPGTIQFLSATTPGARTETAPTTAGYIVQQLGIAVSATEMSVEIDQTVELA